MAAGLGTELYTLATSFDPYGAYRQGQDQPVKADIRTAMLQDTAKELQDERQQAAQAGVGYDGQPLQKMANQLIPNATLVRQDGTVTDAGLMNQSLIQAQKLGKQGQMMLRQAALIDDPTEQAKAMGEARRFQQAALIDAQKIQKQIKETQEAGIYGAAMAQNEREWNAAIEAYKESGLPMPPGMDTRYTPENVQKAKLLGSAQLQNRINDDLRQRTKDERQAARQEQEDGEKSVARARDAVKFLTEYGQPVPTKLARKAGIPIEGEGDVSATGRASVESGGDYGAVNPKSGALGLYQIMPSTLASLRKQDPSLPKTDAEFLANPDAQNKAMKLLEESDKSSLKSDGFKPSNVNLATYHRFGAGDGKKVLTAFENNPNTPLKTALGDKYDTIVAQNPDLAGKTVGQAILQNYGNVPSSKTSETPAGTIQLQKTTATGGREMRYADVVKIASGEASTAIKNIVTMPYDVSGGVFGPERKEGLINSPINALVTNPLTDEAVASYNAEIDNIGKYFARMMSGGLQISKDDAEGYTKQFRIREGEKPLTALTRLAQLRQSFERIAEVKIASKATPKEQLESWKEQLAAVREAIPITVSDVNKIRNAENPQKTLGEWLQETKGKADTAPAKTSSGVTVSNWQ